MNRVMLLIMSSILMAGSLFAGSGSAVNHVGDQVDKTNFEKVSYAPPSEHQSRMELTIYQALATAITQSAVLIETRQQRLMAAENPRKKITIRGRSLTLSYSRNRYEQHCYLAVGPRQKWRTINGQWAAGNVNARAIKRALDVLRANGISVNKVSISVSDPRDVLEAQRMLHSIRLEPVAVIGHDPNALTHATITFNNI